MLEMVFNKESKISLETSIQSFVNKLDTAKIKNDYKITKRLRWHHLFFLSYRNIIIYFRTLYLIYKFNYAHSAVFNIQ